MIYLMKKKFFSLWGDFKVKDQEGYEVYNIKRRFGINKYAVETITRQEDILIKQKNFSLRQTFEIYANGQIYASVTKPFFSFFDKYTAQMYSNDEIVIEGDFFNHEYNIYSKYYGGLASVSKQWFSLTDSYGVQVNDGVDTALILAFVLIISLYHRNNGSFELSDVFD